MTDKQNCTVLGAGLMGRLLAHALAKQGHRVTLHEAGGPDALGAAARVAASMLAPLAESAITDISVVNMGQYSLTRWPAIIAELPEPVFFQQKGTLLVWHRQDAHHARMLLNKLHTNSQHMAADERPQLIENKALTELEPQLAGKFQQAAFLPHEGQLDNRQLLDGLLASLIEQQVQIHWHSQISVHDATTSMASDKDWVFDCRGIGARQDWQQLRGVRGEVIRLHAPDVHLTRPVRLVHPRYPLYIAPKQNHLFVIGATEIETDDTSQASVRSTMELLSAAYSLHSGFAEARIVELNTQLRPTLKNNLPAIQRLSHRCLQINGLYRHGFLIAPAMLDAVMGLVNNDAHLANRFELLLSS